jgi:hypothetical protein
VVRHQPVRILTDISWTVAHAIRADPLLQQRVGPGSVSNVRGPQRERNHRNDESNREYRGIVHQPGRDPIAELRSQGLLPNETTDRTYTPEAVQVPAGVATLAKTSPRAPFIAGRAQMSVSGPQWFIAGDATGLPVIVLLMRPDR